MRASGGHLKLVGTLRGQGLLQTGARRAPVAYQVELYRRGAQQIASGEAESLATARRPLVGPARLQLADGHVVDVTVRDVDETVAAFDIDEAGARHCHETAGKAA